RKAMSSAKDCCSSGETMALPPYLMTIVAPEKVLIHGSASVRASALTWAAASRAAVDFVDISCGLFMRSRRCSLRRSHGSDPRSTRWRYRSEEHTSELQSRFELVCRRLL